MMALRPQHYQTHKTDGEHHVEQNQPIRAFHL
jgi:hypothetical protein